MDKIFNMSLSSRALPESYYIDLPASHYELIDAIEHLQLEADEKIKVRIGSCGAFNEFRIYFTELQLYELNTLGEKLTALDDQQKDAFKGLLQRAINDRNPNIDFQTMMSFADNTNCCQVLYVKDDAALGRFYVDDGRMPKLEGLTEAIYDLLDYEAIGKEIRQKENGVFIGKAFVSQISPMAHSKEYHAEMPSEPDYIIRLKIGERVLELPAEDMDANKELSKPLTVKIVDSAVPYITGGSGYQRRATNEQNIAWLELANELASELLVLREAGMLQTFKAIVEAKRCTVLSEAIELAANTHEYSLSPIGDGFEDIGEAWIRDIIPDAEAAEIIIRNTDLNTLGEEVAPDMGIEFTNYGILKHNYPEQQMGGMNLG